MILYILIIAFIIAADQLTKVWASSVLTEITTMPVIEDVFHFTYVENRGAAFGMLADHRWIFMILSVLGIGPPGTAAVPGCHRAGGDHQG